LPGRFLAVIILPHQAAVCAKLQRKSGGYSAECFVGADP
jgi:hypothetical protein